MNFAQHQLNHVANFWKLGLGATYHLEAQAGGKASLTLTFALPSPSDPIPPPFAPCPTPSTNYSESLNKANWSRIRRREKRASQRAAAAEKAPENGVTEKSNDAEEAASAEKAAIGHSEVCTMPGQSITCAGASTSLLSASPPAPKGAAIICLNCDNLMTSSHQCTLPSTNSIPPISAPLECAEDLCSLQCSPIVLSTGLSQSESQFVKTESDAPQRSATNSSCDRTLQEQVESPPRTSGRRPPSRRRIYPKKFVDSD